jgi:hypothetical protein
MKKNINEYLIGSFILIGLKNIALKTVTNRICTNEIHENTIQNKDCQRWEATTTSFFVMRRIFKNCDNSCLRMCFELAFWAFQWLWLQTNLLPLKFILFSILRNEKFNFSSSFSFDIHLEINSHCSCFIILRNKI